MPWRNLARFRDPGVPKLHNLRRAARAGLRIPPTWWQWATEAGTGDMRPPVGSSPPWIVRSASPTEDAAEQTQAGRFVSREVAEDERGSFEAAVKEVVASLPRDGGLPRGAVFVQPLLRPERGGVCFFDGFYYERTTAPGGNRDLTSGRDRGTVERGAVRRREPWSRWLRRVARCFGPELRSGALLDLELALEGEEPILLQARPARFALRRNPTLSLANHREILGELPSPWIVAALEEAGGPALDYFAEADPEVRKWAEPYAVALGGRAWLNFSFFHRLMDHWGLPRAFVTEGVGGAADSEDDRRGDLLRMARKGARLLGLQARGLREIARAPEALAALQERIETATDLAGLFRATSFGLGVALRTNFALNGALTGLVRVRRFLGLRGRARVTTELMMEEYEVLRSAPPGGRGAALDAWLDRFGHRGPLESDPARPRFAELRELLLADLGRPGQAGGARSPGGREDRPPGRGPLFALDRRRESFRDDLMRAWQILRQRILSQARPLAEEGRLERVDDVFLLAGEDLAGPLPGPDVVAARRARQRRLAALAVPATATRDVIEAVVDGAVGPSSVSPGTVFRGIGLGDRRFEGRVRRASDLVELLKSEQNGEGGGLDHETVLVVPALEPSWAVVFGRVGAVVAELGGELSHASILLREAGTLAVVNCAGVYEALVDGERVRLDGALGLVETELPMGHHARTEVVE